MSEVKETVQKRRVGDGTPGPGRPKGIPNKMTVSAKEAYRLAFDELGGPGALAIWARDNQTEFYKLHARLIPVDVAASHTGANGGPIEHIHGVDTASLSDEQLRAIASIRAQAE